MSTLLIDLPSSVYEYIVKLMNTQCLVAGKQKYRIVECEAYYRADCHPDPYVHGSPEQKQYETWYFNGYGLDITLGKEHEDEDKCVYAGILIRGVCTLEEIPRYVSGPANVLRELIKQFGSVTDSGSTFYLKDLPPELQIERVIYRSTRIGLFQKKGDTDFHIRPYRFLTDLVVEHKFKSKEKALRQWVLDRRLDADAAHKIMGYIISGL
ncbi:hypothetical protein QNI16_27790 [Cytophagaceae bacterium YF14B1]|uniref:Uncharacterized protein n=1 Tax=Xanthocytophaga flava TaxID=3048013 RepID=A0AAE3QW74_9BACT|nr:hypothetical protein [Xanthocytophaga flavus]MDJ1484331.1 hypothetical protein [Xanthocytophaga flavus]